MGIRRQLLLVLGMLGIAACSVVLAKQAGHTQVGGMKVAGESDVAERMAIRDRVRVAVNAEDFASLNSLERQSPDQPQPLRE